MNKPKYQLGDRHSSNCNVHEIDLRDGTKAILIVPSILTINNGSLLRNHIVSIIEQAIKGEIDLSIDCTDYLDSLE